MPELPEVETVRRGLEPVFTGQRLVRVEQRRANLRFPFPDRFVDRLVGRRIEHVGRRAKYLVLTIDTGETLVMHLGMSGRFTISRTEAACDTGHPTELAAFAHATGGTAKHDHVVFETEAGGRVTYNDPRRFGFMVLVEDGGVDRHALFRDLGVEPLGNALSAAYLAQRAVGKGVDLKAFLMDQRIVAGLGNIYVAEALFRAGLSPHRKARSLARADGRPSVRADRLVPAIRETLNDAVAAGGSSLRDYRQADGDMGYFQHTFQVYGRDGEPCKRDGCGGVIRRTVQAGRSTFSCATCQR